MKLHLMAHGAAPRALPFAGMLLSLCAFTARAEPLPAYSTLLERAGRSAPRLQIIGAYLEEARGRVLEARAYLNPQVSVTAENFAGSRDFSRIAPVQNTISISEPIDWSGKRRSRIAAELADANASEKTASQLKADFAYDLALAYLAAEWAEGRTVLENQALQRAEDDQRIAKALVDGGRESPLHLLQSQAALSTARSEFVTAQSQSRQALIRIAVLSGNTEPFTEAGSSLLRRADEVLQVASKVPSGAPALQSADAEREAAEQRVLTAQREALPDVTLSVGDRWLPGFDTRAWVAEFSFPLPLFDRKRGQIARRSAEANAARARVADIELAFEGEWRSAVLELLAAQSRLDAAKEGNAASAEAYRLARLGYDQGRTPFADLLLVREKLIEAERQTLDARRARLQAEAQLAHLKGEIPFGED